MSVNAIPENIVIKTPLVPLEALGVLSDEVTVFENELFLPRVLVAYGIYKTTSDVKRNIKAFEKRNGFSPWMTLERPMFEYIKVGRKHFWLIVGE